MENCGLISAEHKQVQHNAVVEETDEDDDISAETNENLEWLKDNKEPWLKCAMLWKDTGTSKARLRQLQNERVTVHDYMNSYPGLKDKSGFLLLEIDSNAMHPDKSMALYAQWPKLSAFLFKKNSASLTTEINDAFTPEGKKMLTIRSLANVFPVAAIARKTKDRDAWKPSREEMKDTLIMIVKRPEDILEDLKTRRDKYHEYGLKMGPQAVVVGPPDAPGLSCVVINSIIYQVESPSATFDLAFKARFALDAAYPKETITEWVFLQRAVYGINTSKDRVHLKGRLLALISEYESFK